MRSTFLPTNNRVVWRPQLLLLLLLAADACWGLRDVRLEVPEAVRRGETVKLVCEYDLERAALYSIKWYKGDDEFYRYVPKESPPTRVFPLPGVNVDISRSGMRAVVLTDVQRELTSFYKCEVSADAPLFHTAIKSATMLVVDIPQDVPIITIDKLRYSLDEPIAANCTSLASFPAANITWYVNEMPVIPSGSWIIDVKGYEDRGGAMETAVSELRLVRPVFRENRLTLRCRASLYSLYKHTTDVTLSLEEPQDASPWPPASVRHHDAANIANSGTPRVFATPEILWMLVFLLISRCTCSRLTRR